MITLYVSLGLILPTLFCVTTHLYMLSFKSLFKLLGCPHVLFLIDNYKSCNYIYYVVVSLGRGVFTTKTFSKDEFLLVYKGELVKADEGYRREDSYHPDLGSFLFFFKDGAKCFW